jgi:hypothetical protein
MRTPMRYGGMIAAGIALFLGAAALGRAQTDKMTIDQTLSDEAQKTTIAFDALGFLTGSIGADSFFPPGKVADFWGFQYLRDNDKTEMGHNTDFLTRAANNVLYILTPAQLADLVALAQRQVGDIAQYATDRFVLMKAFRRMLEGDVPAGRPSLDREAVKAFSVGLYHLDGQMSLARAEVMGRIIRSFSSGQRAYLDAMAGKGMLTWPNLPDQLDKSPYTQPVHVAIMTFAGDIFAWYAGSIDSDVYFCPERQATYFGSFYLKDAPAVGNPDYSIGTNLTADLGNALLNALTPAQAQLISGLVDIQRPWLTEIVDIRRRICTLLRGATVGRTPDAAAILELVDRYGELDGEIVTTFASRFVAVGRTLSAGQKTDLLGLRSILIGSLAPAGAFLYADPIDVPDIPNTDFLFGASTKSGTGRK